MRMLGVLCFAFCIHLHHAKILLFWAVDSSKRTQALVKKNVHHVEDAGIQFDVVLGHYSGVATDWDQNWYTKYVVDSVRGHGYKFHLMQRAYKEGLWEKQYEFIWALDTDIDVSKADIRRFLDMARQTQSPIVGPTYVTGTGQRILLQAVQDQTLLRREGSSPSRDVLRHGHVNTGPDVIQAPDSGCDFRHTDFVELTAPLLRASVLKVVLHDCHDCIHDESDWGLDLMWCKFVSERLNGRACALIDATPVMHLDWGLASISGKFYKAMEHVQAHYGKYWAEKKVLDCEPRGEGLMEIPEEPTRDATAEGPLRVDKKTSSKDIAGSKSGSTKLKRQREPDSSEDGEDEDEEVDDGDVEAEDRQDGQDVQDENGLPANEAGPSASNADSDDGEETSVAGQNAQEEKDSTPSRNSTSQTQRASSNASHVSRDKAASQKKSKQNTTAARRSDNVAEEGEDEEEASRSEAEEEDEEEAEPTHSSETQGIFKVKAATNASIHGFGPPEDNVKRGSDRQSLGLDPEGDADLGLDDGADAGDAADPSSNGAEAHSFPATRGDLAAVSPVVQDEKIGQDQTLEFQEVTQGQDVSRPRARTSLGGEFKETEKRLREDIDALRKLQEEMSREKAQSNPSQRTFGGRKEAMRKDKGRVTSSNARTARTARTARQRHGESKNHKALSLLELDAGPAEEADVQVMQIYKLAGGMREVAMNAAKEVEASLGSATASQVAKTRSAAIESVQRAVAEEVAVQEREHAEASGTFSELSQHSREAELAGKVQDLEAKLSQTMQSAKNHQADQRKTALAERIASDVERKKEEELLIARAKQIVELKAQVRWDEERLRQEKEEELMLKNQVLQLEDRIPRKKNSSLHKEHPKEKTLQESDVQVKRTKAMRVDARGRVSA